MWAEKPSLLKFDIWPFKGIHIRSKGDWLYFNMHSLKALVLLFYSSVSLSPTQYSCNIISRVKKFNKKHKIISRLKRKGDGSINFHSPLSLSSASNQPQKRFFWFHSLSPCLTITILYLDILKIGLEKREITQKWDYKPVLRVLADDDDLFWPWIQCCQID